MKLQFQKVVGTSATVPQHMVYSGRKLAYVADGGVIVCEVDAKTGSLGKQRLFVANSGVADGPGDEYSSKVSSYLDRAESPEKRDEYDLPTDSTYVYGGDKILASRKKTAGENAENSPSKLKDRVRDISCVAISPNGRVLAVGESGYQPRVLLYSLAPSASGTPFAVIHEHTFGVRHLVFSPDSRFLASLGQLSDGYLNIWRYTATSVSLRAGNKCSSIVNKLLWHSTTSIVTAGLRFLKVWTFESPDSNKAVVLRGRNVVLGKNLDCDFTQAVSLSSDEVLLSGGFEVLYVLSLSGMSIVPVNVPDSPSSFSGLQADRENQKVSFFDGTQPRLVEYSSLKPTAVRSAPTSPSKVTQMLSSLSLKPSPSDVPIVSSQLSSRNDTTHLIYLTNRKSIHLYDFISETEYLLVASPVTIAAGMKQASNGDLIVYSKHGEIIRIDDGVPTLVASTVLIQAEQVENEVCAANFDGSSAYFGDRYGQLTIANAETGETILKAHSSSVNDVLVFEISGIKILCTTSRDRTVQLFYYVDGNWKLLQTIANHTGNILFSKFHDKSLIICSADRSLAIYGFRESPETDQPLEVFQKRVITLKHPPTAMEVLDSELHVATNDKSVHVYDSAGEELKYSVKLTNENGDSLGVENFALLDNHIVASFTDRSIRLYSAKYSKQLAISWGHSDSIVSIVGIDGLLYSMSSNGCLFTWNVSQPAVEIQDSASIKDEDSDSSIVEPESSPLYAKVTRKILPVMAATPKQTRTSSTPKFEREASPSRRSSLMGDPSSPTPSSLSAPKLTSATLKRMEARNSSKTTIASLSSPSKASSPKPTTIKSASPARAQSPSRIISKTTSSFRLSSSPTRTLDSITNSQPRLTPQNDSDSMNRASAYVAIMKSHAQKGLFSSKEKEKLVEDLIELVEVLGGSATAPTKYDQLLEKFGEQLVEVVQKKINA